MRVFGPAGRRANVLIFPSRISYHAPGSNDPGAFSHQRNFSPSNSGATAPCRRRWHTSQCVPQSPMRQLRRAGEGTNAKQSGPGVRAHAGRLHQARTLGRPALLSLPVLRAKAANAQQPGHPRRISANHRAPGRPVRAVLPESGLHRSRALREVRHHRRRLPTLAVPVLPQGVHARCTSH